MKKVLFLFLALILVSSCRKEETPTTYQIINNVTKTTTSDPYLDGSMYEVVVYHYLGSDIIKQDDIDKISSGGGKSELIEAPGKSEKIKISFKFLPPQSSNYNLSSNVRKYIVAYTLLNKGENNIATITDNTSISSSISESYDNQDLLMISTEILTTIR